MGILVGIARHARPRAAMETLDKARVTFAGGIVGDYRGAMKGKPYKRQVTLLERVDWDAAMAEVGRTIDWPERRANLLIDGLDLPQTPGVRLSIGDAVVLKVERQTDPCERMEAVAPGLRAALMVDWRGGVCTSVAAEGDIRIGDRVELVSEG